MAFSEQETKSVKRLCDKYPNIIAAMNFHSYGNMWVHPFNYMQQPNVYPKSLMEKYISFYSKFKKKVKKVNSAQYGNAIEMV